MCQRKKYQSRDWPERDGEEGALNASHYYYTRDEDDRHLEETIYKWDLIEDALVLADVNSLYPTAQAKFEYAYGKREIKVFNDPEEQVREARRLQSLQDSDDLMIRTCYCVDITPPADLITSFLMERDKKTNTIIHNLEEKKQQWYWGQELEEAIILKYVVNRVHKKCIFQYKGKIFDQYVNKCWQGRLDNPKSESPIINQCYKSMLCELTGKFGQHTHATNSCIFSSQFEPSEKQRANFEKLVSNIRDHSAIFSRDGQNVAIALEVVNPHPEPSYPIYLSAQILAYARVYMSRIMRVINAYHDVNNAIYYTDTDSLCIREGCLERLYKANLLGTGLGQLKCDLRPDLQPTILNTTTGKFEIDERESWKFAKIIKAIWLAAKGPYCLLYINPPRSEEEKFKEVTKKLEKLKIKVEDCSDEFLKQMMKKEKTEDRRVRAKIRMKGIPVPPQHLNFFHFEEHETKIMEKELLRYDNLLAWIDDPFCRALPPNIVKERIFMFKSAVDGSFAFYRYPSYNLLHNIMHSEGELFCFFGGMKKSFHKKGSTSETDFLTVRPTVVRRQVCRNDWWAKSGRQYVASDSSDVRGQEYALTFPLGYISSQTRKNIAYEKYVDWMIAQSENFENF